MLSHVDVSPKSGIPISSDHATPLLLASRSPRRQELLAALTCEFSVEAADVDETPLPYERPEAMVMRLSITKAAALSSSAKSFGCAVLAADTIVTLDDALLGKPADASEAADMLRLLRCRTHRVYTGVTLAHGGRLETRFTASDVTMRDYSDDEIAAYVATGDPLDKAGAYAIQHEWFAPVASWQGCYASIMGLPLKLVADLLKEAGLIGPIDVASRCSQVLGICCTSTPGLEPSPGGC